jgi:hypothetical protein
MFYYCFQNVCMYSYSQFLLTFVVSNIVGEQNSMQCVVLRDKVAKYQSMLFEGMFYEINISVSKNNYKCKPTCHDYRLSFKDMTTVEPVDDSIVHFYAFKFTSYDGIFKVKNEDSHLIDIFLEVNFYIYCLLICYVFFITLDINFTFHFLKILLEYYLGKTRKLQK